MAPQRFFSGNNNEYEEIANLVGEICVGNVENNTSPSNDIVNVELPEDLVTEILLKLPVKSLIRLKSVCKSWSFLIDSPVFIDNHLQLHRRNPRRGLFPIKCLKLNCFVEEGNNPFPFAVMSSVGTCNGVICFNTDSTENPLVLCNPSTREFCFLPKECSGSFYAFCYISQTQEYKLLSFKWGLGNNTYLVHMRIWTSGMKSKKSSIRDVRDLSLPGEIDYYEWGGHHVVNGGSIVWLGYDDIVICYDALEDKFSKVNLPPAMEPEPESTYRYLAVHKESVIMFVYPYESPISFDIWKLVDNDDVSKVKSWVKYRTIRPFLEPCVDMRVHPVGGCWYDRWVLCSKKITYDGAYCSNDVFYYDLEINQVEDYKAIDPRTIIVQFVNYVESLVSPKYICSM